MREAFPQTLSTVHSIRDSQLRTTNERQNELQVNILNARRRAVSLSPRGATRRLSRTNSIADEKLSIPTPLWTQLSELFSKRSSAAAARHPSSRIAGWTVDDAELRRPLIAAADPESIIPSTQFTTPVIPQTCGFRSCFYVITRLRSQSVSRRATADH